jgi:hypothetical protein
MRLTCQKQMISTVICKLAHLAHTLDVLLVALQARFCNHQVHLSARLRRHLANRVNVSLILDCFASLHVLTTGLTAQIVAKMKANGISFKQMSSTRVRCSGACSPCKYTLLGSWLHNLVILCFRHWRCCSTTIHACSLRVCAAAISFRFKSNSSAD